MLKVSLVALFAMTLATLTLAASTIPMPTEAGTAAIVATAAVS